jgi:hypothetical protein
MRRPARPSRRARALHDIILGDATSWLLRMDEGEAFEKISAYTKA